MESINKTDREKVENIIIQTTVDSSLFNNVSFNELIGLYLENNNMDIKPVKNTNTNIDQIELPAFHKNAQRGDKIWSTHSPLSSLLHKAGKGTDDTGLNVLRKNVPIIVGRTRSNEYGGLSEAYNLDIPLYMIDITKNIGNALIYKKKVFIDLLFILDEKITQYNIYNTLRHDTTTIKILENIYGLAGMLGIDDIRIQNTTKDPIILIKYHQYLNEKFAELIKHMVIIAVFEKKLQYIQDGEKWWTKAKKWIKKEEFQKDIDKRKYIKRIYNLIMSKNKDDKFIQFFHHFLDEYYLKDQILENPKSLHMSDHRSKTRWISNAFGAQYLAHFSEKLVDRKYKFYNFNMFFDILELVDFLKHYIYYYSRKNNMLNTSENTLLNANVNVNENANVNANANVNVKRYDFNNSTKQNNPNQQTQTQKQTIFQSLPKVTNSKKKN